MVSTVKDKSLTNDILVVDDEADIRLLIKGILNDEGLSVREAAAGRPVSGTTTPRASSW